MAIDDLLGQADRAVRDASRGTPVGDALAGGASGAAIGAIVGEAAAIGATAATMATGVAIGSAIPLPGIGTAIGALIGALVALAQAFRTTPEEARAWLSIVRSAPGMMRRDGLAIVDPSPAGWARLNGSMRRIAGEAGPDKLEDPAYIAQIQIGGAIASTPITTPDAARAVLALLRANPAVVAAHADTDPRFGTWYRGVRELAGDAATDVDSVEKAWWKRLKADPSLALAAAAASLGAQLRAMPWLVAVEPSGAGLVVTVNDASDVPRVIVPRTHQGYPVELRVQTPSSGLGLRGWIVAGGIATLGLAALLGGRPRRPEGV